MTSSASERIKQRHEFSGRHSVDWSALEIRAVPGDDKLTTGMLSNGGNDSVLEIRQVQGPSTMEVIMPKSGDRQPADDPVNGFVRGWRVEVLLHNVMNCRQGMCRHERFDFALNSQIKDSSRSIELWAPPLNHIQKNVQIQHHPHRCLSSR